MKQWQIILPIPVAVLLITAAAAQTATPEVPVIPGIPVWVTSLLQGGLAAYLVVWWTQKAYPKLMDQLEKQQALWREERRADHAEHMATAREIYEKLHNIDKDIPRTQGQAQ